MTELRKDLPKLPYHLLGKPIDERGYPIPWFVVWVDGKPDFRLTDVRKIMHALKDGLCWICGERIGKYRAFVSGPMAALNSIAAEPPSHEICAKFAVKACPFLLHPKAKRREAGMTELGTEMSEHGDDRNPGVSLLWVTQDFTVHQTKNSLLFEMGRPDVLTWWRGGRPATREEARMALAESHAVAREQTFQHNGVRAVLELSTAWKFAQDHLLPPIGAGTP